MISSDFAKNYGVVKEDGSIRPLQAGDKICDFAGNKSIVAKVINRNMPQEEADAMGMGRRWRCLRQIRIWMWYRLRILRYPVSMRLPQSF